MNARIRAGIWRLADPKISLASMAAMWLGAFAAGSDGPVSPLWLALTLFAVFCVEVAKNASGEIYDWDSGTDRRIAEEDRSPFSGGKRVMVDGLLTRGQTWAVAVVSYGIATILGAVIVLGHEPRAFWFAVAGVALAFFYHGPPFRLSYRGLGEVAVGLAYGPLLVSGTYLVLRGTVTPQAVALGIPVGLLIAGFLWINEFPDYRADAASGKRNLVVVLGRNHAAKVFTGMIVAAFLVLAALPFFGVPWGVWLGAVAAVPGFSAARTALTHPERTAQIVPAQARTLLAFVLLAVGGGVGMLVGGPLR
jgi:1,4-dihydroxy-2-naphthoate octaprenyltransferase